MKESAVAARCGGVRVGRRRAGVKGDAITVSKVEMPAIEKEKK